MPVPVWWPEVLAAASLRRMAAGMLLDHATPTIDDDGVLRLQFTNPRTAAAWRDSGAQTALEAAMRHRGQEMPVHAIGPEQEAALR